MFWNFANHRDPNSWAAQLRQNRRDQCKQIILSIPRPMRVLNVGGSEEELSSMGVMDEPGISFTVLNLDAPMSARPNVTSVIGDARNMDAFGDGEFDFVFSNSVIEHVGTIHDARRMAAEIRRVGKRYYVQTPNRNFPIEPHFLFPMFQFLPIWLRKRLLQRFNLGWNPKTPDPKAAETIVRSINLLTKKQMKDLFSDSALIDERVFGLTKSIQCIKVSV